MPFFFFFFDMIADDIYCLNYWLCVAAYLDDSYSNKYKTNNELDYILTNEHNEYPSAYLI